MSGFPEVMCCLRQLTRPGITASKVSIESPIAEMDQSYLIDMLERAFLLQQKRVWSLQMLRKLDNGVLFPDASPKYLSNLRQNLESNLRTAREALEEIARESGFDAGPGRLFDPTFILGANLGHFSDDNDVDDVVHRIEASEHDQGKFYFRSMCRELAVKHEGYRETVEQKVLADMAFYKACQDMELAPSGPDTTDDGQRID